MNVPSYTVCAICHNKAVGALNGLVTCLCVAMQAAGP